MVVVSGGRGTAAGVSSHTVPTGVKDQNQMKLLGVKDDLLRKGKVPRISLLSLPQDAVAWEFLHPRSSIMTSKWDFKA